MAYPVRVYCALLLLLVFSSALLIGQFASCIQNVKPSADEITVYEQRFEAIKKDLPAYGTVGYVTNIGEGAFKAYTLTVYALCPVMPVPNKASDLVVGNFDPRQQWKLPPNAPVRVFRDYGNGVVLLRHIQR